MRTFCHDAFDRFGAKAEDFAEIGRVNHAHSKNNPYSQFQDEYTLDQGAKVAYDPRPPSPASMVAQHRTAVQLLSSSPKPFLDARPELKSQAVLIAGQCLRYRQP